MEIYHPDAHGSDSDLGLVPGGKVKLVKSASVDVSMSNARWEDRVSFTSGPAYVALFRGSHAPEYDHWSCAGRESLVFFLTWAVLKVGGEVRPKLCMGVPEDSEYEKEQLTTRI